MTVRRFVRGRQRRAHVARSGAARHQTVPRNPPPNVTFCRRFPSAESSHTTFAFETHYRDVFLVQTFGIDTSAWSGTSLFSAGTRGVSGAVNSYQIGPEGSGDLVPEGLVNSTQEGGAMKLGRMFFLACLLLFSATYGLVFAQAEKPNRKELRLDVGDPNSFQDNLRVLGVVSTGFVFLLGTCDPNEFGGDDRCITLNPAPAETVFLCLSSPRSIKYSASCLCLEWYW